MSEQVAPVKLLNEYLRFMNAILLSIEKYALVIINSRKNHVLKKRRKQLQTNLVLQK